jgi:hypothetical protein
MQEGSTSTDHTLRVDAVQFEYDESIAEYSIRSDKTVRYNDCVGRLF